MMVKMMTKITVNNSGIVRTKNNVEGGDDRVVQEL